MRKPLLAVSAIVAMAGLASCSGSTQQSIDQFVASFGSQPYVQMHLTASASGPGTAKVQDVLGMVSIDMRYASASGASLSQSAGQVNSEVLVNVGTTAAADLRDVGGNIYVRFDFNAVAGIPGINVSATRLADAQLAFGGRWFELSKSLLAGVVPASPPRQGASAARGLGQKLVDALAKIIDNAPYTTLSNGYSESGTLQQIANAEMSVVNAAHPGLAAPKGVKGTYKLTLTTSGTTVTGGSVAVTAPNAQGGDVTGTLSAVVTHDADAITAPGNVTVVTAQMLAQLRGLGASKLG